MVAVTIPSDFRTQESKICHCFHICHEVMGLDTRILIFWMLSFKPVFSFSSFTFIKRLFSSSSLSAMRVVSSAYLRLYKLRISLGPHKTWICCGLGGCTDSHSPLPALPSHFGPRRPHRSAPQLVLLSIWAVPSSRSGDSRRQQQQAPLRRNRSGPGSSPTLAHSYVWLPSTGLTSLTPSQAPQHL